MKRPIITAIAFAALAVNGMTFTFMGTSLPAIQTHLAIGIDQGGTLMASLQTGLTLFSFIGGVLSDRFRRERILMGGCLLLGVGALFFGAVTSFAVNMVVVWVMGAGMGCILSASNTLLISLYPARKGAILNIHHVFFGVGALLGPAFMGYLILHGNRWRQGYLGEGLFLAALAALFFLSGGRRPLSKHDAPPRPPLGGLLKDRQFSVILLVNALSVGSQVSTMLLGVSFLMEAKQASLAVAGIAISLFSIFMGIGRLICSRLTLTIRHTPILLTLLWFQVGILLLAWLGGGYLSVAAIALSGFTFSGIYPTSLALVGALFPRLEGSALGILSTMSSFGAVVLCWLTGYVAGLTNMRSGLMVIIIACATALLIFQGSRGALGRREARAATDENGWKQGE